MIAVLVAQSAMCLHAHGEVWMGQIARQLESRGSFVFGDGNVELMQEWSVARFDTSGWFYPSGTYGSNVDVFVFAGLQDISQITNADEFDYDTNKALEAEEGSTVFFRGGGYYAAWVIDDIIGIAVPGEEYETDYYLNGRWYFQDNRSGDFSSVPDVSVGFKRGNDLSSDSYSTLDIVLSDIENDGDLDAVLIDDSGSTRIYVNPTALNPWSTGVPGILLNTQPGVSTLAFATTHFAGRFDLVAGAYNNTNTLYDSSLLLASSVNGLPVNPELVETISSNANSTKAIVVTDFNRDGYIDLLAGNDGQPNQFFKGDFGSNPFRNSTGTPVTFDSDPTNDLAYGDFDGDGDSDLVVANSRGGTGQIRIYFNNGSQEPFELVTGETLNTGDWDATSVTAGDINGDNSIDLVVGSSSDEANNYFYLNNRSSSPFAGVVAMPVTKANPDDETTDLVLMDFNKDGRADLVVASRNDSTEAVSQVFINSGIETPFSGSKSITINSEPVNATSIAVGDVDLDGDVDIVMATENSSDRVYITSFVADNPSNPSSSLIGAGSGGGGSLGFWTLFFLSIRTVQSVMSRAGRSRITNSDYQKV